MKLSTQKTEATPKDRPQFLISQTMLNLKYLSHKEEYIQIRK